MRTPRSAQIMRDRTQYFHVVSRVVDRRKIFGDDEKEVFLQIIRRYESFSMVKVLFFCLMGNHFHLLLRVPGKDEIPLSHSEIWERLGHIYTPEFIENKKHELLEIDGCDHGEAHDNFYSKMADRMTSLSAFVKDIKQSFTSKYNRINNRRGTLWEERFKSLLLADSENALQKVAAYIALNPVRAGLENEVGTYRWSSLHLALQGDVKCRSGIEFIVSGEGSSQKGPQALNAFLNLVKPHGNKASATSVGANRSGGTRDTGQILLKRNRFFSEGLAIGPREWLRSFYMAKREFLSKTRKKIGSRVPGTYFKGLYSYRNVSREKNKYAEVD